MKRRNLILASAGILVPALARAAKPCPPPQISISGGGSATTNCAIVSGSSYSTNFTSTENPISDGGKWINGKSVGVDWNNVQCGGGKAYATAIATGYNDDIAILNTSFTANQYAQGTVSRASGYSPGVSHEIELLLRFQITARNARGYEILWGVTGELNLVRWNGPVGNYTPFGDAGGGYGPNVGAARDGDVVRAEITGNTVKVYINNALAHTFTDPDSTWNTGQPGIGFWPTGSATPSNYCWKSFSAGNL
jgi:hypothetical protein